VVAASLSPGGDDVPAPSGVAGVVKSRAAVAGGAATQTSGEPVRHDGPCMNSLSSVSIYNINLSLVIVPQDPPFFSAPISRLAKCNND